MATLVDIQKRLHERTSQVGAVSKITEMNGMALKKLTEEINQRHEMMRAALGPIADIQKHTRIAVTPEISSVAEHMRKVAAQLEARYRLPELQETARMFREGMGRDIQRLMERYHHQSSEIQRAMEAMRTPWLDIENQASSIAGFVKLQGIGRMVAVSQPFGMDITDALRVDLGDWRKDISWPENIFDDPVVRTKFYAERGLDPSLTAVPAEAFSQELEIAGLRVSLPELEMDEDEWPGFERTNLAQRYLLRMERDLRRFIDEKMTAAFGENWIKHRVSGDIWKDWKNKKETAKANGEPDRPLIEYADFTDYKAIITRKDNWDAVFKQYFERKSSVEESLQRLYPARVCAMHGRLIIQDDELFIYAEIARIWKAIK